MSEGPADLLDAARAVQAHAHAPYSHYPVGAALIVASGRVFVGCNVENASYGLSLCAERSAILQMVAAGEKDPIGIVVITRGPIVGTPCGACRQVLSEFAPKLRIIVVGLSGKRREISLEALLPEAFKPSDLR